MAENANSSPSIIMSAIGMGIQAYQYNQEKKRQQRLDRYNQAINRRDYNTQRVYSSPTYQKQMLRNAGWNPMASGEMPAITPPSDGSPVTGNPMTPTDLGASGFANTIATNQANENQAEANRIRLKELDLAQDKLNVEKNQIEQNIKLERVNQAKDIWINGDKEFATKLLRLIPDYEEAEFAQDSNGTVSVKNAVKVGDAQAANLGADTEKKKSEKAGVEAATEKTKAEIEGVKADNESKKLDYISKSIQNEIQAMKLRYADRREQIDLMNLEASLDGKLKENVYSALTVEEKELELVRSRINTAYETLGGSENISPEDKLKLAEAVATPEGFKLYVLYLIRHRQFLSTSEFKKKMDVLEKDILDYQQAKTKYTKDQWEQEGFRNESKYVDKVFEYGTILGEAAQNFTPAGKMK